MRHYFTKEDYAKAHMAARMWRAARRDAELMRRESELALLEKLHAELAMPEWYPER